MRNTTRKLCEGITKTIRRCYKCNSHLCYIQASIEYDWHRIGIGQLWNLNVARFGACNSIFCIPLQVFTCRYLNRCNGWDVCKPCRVQRTMLSHSRTAQSGSKHWRCPEIDTASSLSFLRFVKPQKSGRGFKQTNMRRKDLIGAPLEPLKWCNGKMYLLSWSSPHEPGDKSKIMYLAFDPAAKRTHLSTWWECGLRSLNLTMNFFTVVELNWRRTLLTLMMNLRRFMMALLPLLNIVSLVKTRFW